MAPKIAPGTKPNITASQTLYVSNLPEKLGKEDLRRELYMLFSTYGSVLDIVAQKTTKMRGQAHIVYKDTQTASQAMRNLNEFEFFGRPLRIQYSKSKSDFISKLDGTFKIPVYSTSDKAAAPEAAIGDKGTALQQSVFGGAPPAAAGVKRTREDDEGSDAMEEDEEEMEMDESDDD